MGTTKETKSTKFQTLESKPRIIESELRPESQRPLIFVKFP